MSLDLCFKQLHVVHIKGFLVLVRHFPVRHFLVRHFPVLQIPVTLFIVFILLAQLVNKLALTWVPVSIPLLSEVKP